MSKIGRNDPCYCGSGKKYKNCHLRADQEAEREARALKQAAWFVRRDLLSFAQDERFAVEFAQALPLYWNGYYDLDTADEMSRPEAMRFFDWFLHDYEPENGRRLINVYVAEERDNLSSHQQAVLDGWAAAGPAAAYELVDYEGKTLHLRDLVTGETVDVHEPGGRGSAEIGDVILARLVPVQDHLEFSTTAAYLPADEIADLAEKIQQAKTDFLAENPDATHEEFMRRHNVMLVHHALEQADAHGRWPVSRLDPNHEDKKPNKLVQQLKRLKS